MNEYKYLEEKAKEAVDVCKNDGETILVTCVDGFITDQEALHLRDMLWYARDNGVEVRMVPATQHDQ